MSDLVTKRSHNIHVIAILMIVAIVIVGFWVFGLNEKLFGPSQNRESTPQNDIVVVPDVKINPENQESESAPDIHEKGKSQSTISSPIVNREEQIKKSEQTTYKKVKELESKEFVLSGTGTTYEVTPTLSKPAELYLIIKPVDKTGISQFSVSEGRITIGGTGIIFDDGKVEVKDKTITITSVNDDAQDPFFALIGSLDESILDYKDAKQKFKLEDQLVYITKDEKHPQHLDISGTIIVRN